MFQILDLYQTSDAEVMARLPIFPLLYLSLFFGNDITTMTTTVVCFGFLDRLKKKKVPKDKLVVLEGFHFLSESGACFDLLTTPTSSVCFEFFFLPPFVSLASVSQHCI